MVHDDGGTLKFCHVEEMQGIDYIVKIRNPPGKVAWGVSMGFLESLPAGCPPANSHDKGCESAFRLVPNSTPVAVDFASYAARRRPPPIGVDPCRWASCSLYLDLDTVAKKRLAFKNLQKYLFVAELKIAPGSGRIQGDDHIDFWMYDTFDPLAAISRVMEL